MWKKTRVKQESYRGRLKARVKNIKNGEQLIGFELGSDIVQTYALSSLFWGLVVDNLERRETENSLKRLKPIKILFYSLNKVMK